MGKIGQGFSETCDLGAPVTVVGLTLAAACVQQNTGNFIVTFDDNSTLDLEASCHTSLMIEPKTTQTVILTLPDETNDDTVDLDNWTVIHY